MFTGAAHTPPIPSVPTPPPSLHYPHPTHYSQTQAVIEGLGITLSKMTAPPPPSMPFVPGISGQGPGGQDIGPLIINPPGGAGPADLGASSSGGGVGSIGGGEAEPSSSSGGWFSWLSGGGGEQTQVRGVCARAWA